MLCSFLKEAPESAAAALRIKTVRVEKRNRKAVARLTKRVRKLGIKYDQIDGVVASDQVFVKDPSGFTWEFQEQK